MKKIILIFLFSILIFSIVKAQWLVQFSGTNSPLTSVYFTDVNNGFIVNSNDTILKTINGGTNWIPQATGVLNGIRSIYFTNSTTGYVVGGNGLILKTTDGGNIWTPQNSGITTLLNSVFFPTVDTGYVIGQWGTILKTTNGGNLWNVIYGDSSNDFISIYFVNANIGYITGFINSGFRVLKTTDGGNSWAVLPYTGANDELSSVFFINKDTGFVASQYYPGIYKTTDGGNTWSQQSLNTGLGISSIFFVNDLIGYAVGGIGGEPLFPSSKQILKTTDGGSTWSVQYQGGSFYLLSVFFTDVNNGCAVGYNGTILKTSNGGTTWIQNNDNAQNVNINIYPNPTTGNFTVKVLQETKKVCVLNAVGQVIEEKKTGNNYETVFNLNKSGLYFVQVTTAKGIETKKVIVCR